MLTALATSANQTSEVPENFPPLKIVQGGKPHNVGYFAWLEALDRQEDLSNANYRVLSTLARQADTRTGSRVFLSIMRLIEKTKMVAKAIYRALDWAENRKLIAVDRKRSRRKWDHAVIQLTDPSYCHSDTSSEEDPSEVAEEVSPRQSKCHHDNPEPEFSQVRPPKSKGYLSPSLSLSLKDRDQDQQPREEREIFDGTSSGFFKLLALSRNQDSVSEKPKTTPSSAAPPSLETNGGVDLETPVGSQDASQGRATVDLVQATRARQWQSRHEEVSGDLRGVDGGRTESGELQRGTREAGLLPDLEGGGHR